MIQTIDAVRKFLNAELAKHKTLTTLGKFAQCLFKNQTAFQETKTKGVGREPIAKFLGGNWNVSKVEGATNVLDDKNLSREAASVLAERHS